MNGRNGILRRSTLDVSERWKECFGKVLNAVEDRNVKSCTVGRGMHDQ